MKNNIRLLICISILVSCLCCSYPEQIRDTGISNTEKIELNGMRTDMLKSAGKNIPERRFTQVQINARVLENNDAITILETPPEDKLLLAVYTATGKRNENLMPLVAKGIYLARKATNGRNFVITARQEEFGIKKPNRFEFWSQDREPYYIYSIEIKCYDGYKKVD